MAFRQVLVDLLDFKLLSGWALVSFVSFEAELVTYRSSPEEFGMRRQPPAECSSRRRFESALRKYCVVAHVSRTDIPFQLQCLSIVK